MTESHPAVFSRKLKGYASSAEHETSRAQQSARPPYLITESNLLMTMWLAPTVRMAGNAAWCSEEQSHFPKAAEALFPVRTVGYMVQTHDKVERLISDGCDPLTARPRPSPGVGVVGESLGCHGQNSPRPLLIREAAADTLSWGSSQATDFCSVTLHEGERDCPISTANLPT